MADTKFAHAHGRRFGEQPRPSCRSPDEIGRRTFGLRSLFAATAYAAFLARATADYGAAGFVTATIIGYLGFALIQGIRAQRAAVILFGAFTSAMLGGAHFAGAWWMTYASVVLGFAMDGITCSNGTFIAMAASISLASFCGCVAVLMALRRLARRESPVRGISFAVAAIFAFLPACYTIVAVNSLLDPVFWSTYAGGEGEQWLNYHVVAFSMQLAQGAAIAFLLCGKSDARFSASAASWVVCNQWLVLAILYPMSDFV